MESIFSCIDQVDSFLNEQWFKILWLFNHDDRLIFTFGTSLVHFISFLVLNAFFMYVDFTGKPKWMLKYKIQKDKNFPVESRRFFWACCAVVLFNEILSCVLIYLSYPIMKLTGMSCDQPVPQLWKMYLLYVGFGYLNIIAFFYLHKLMHHPSIYKYFHKMHHEWVAPISIASVYSHPIDHIFSNFVPYFIGPVLLGSHLSLTWWWIIYAQMESSYHHSNYHLPFLSSPQYHNYHHVK
uniref:LOW QUALITY PROTEIN: fatty acid hydroxylase domain-containing protein 2 n=1 Tax=Ciona intestinalis TaxID=7719 RepID=UPI000EF54B26|nr:LOW QUALITY PROTEIN: fatty acid hydroxylase domain-containing protein 2 [Ciona intestinalis]|eukprot:XP_026696609.1 LOW QUALITY PROTEIN: fatty acid hydroxylase domain-containing protein 2 [Ciona intestinalis]